MSPYSGFEKDMMKRAFDLVLEHFEYDLPKACFWFITKNPNFGDVSPIQLIHRNRIHKVLQFIEGAINENRPE